MTKDETLKLALEALNTTESDCGGRAWEREQEAITAIKEALAQPEQEPVAWIYKGEKSFDGNKYSDEYELTASKQVALWKDKDAKPLYTTPPQRTWVEIDGDDWIRALELADFDKVAAFEFFEAKLKELNT